MRVLKNKENNKFVILSMNLMKKGTYMYYNIFNFIMF